MNRDGTRGLLLPYQASIEHAEKKGDWDPIEVVAFVPDGDPSTTLQGDEARGGDVRSNDTIRSA